ncbi:MAG TPA: sodium-translocating pyrophosphatase [candidate division Zixibacteria bacterium]|nr:sodium-translocating pyrophosphatase [candidate division Zixibacteria bacterium]
MSEKGRSAGGGRRLYGAIRSVAAGLAAALAAPLARASEADIVVPDLNTGDFFGMTGHNLLLWGIVVCLLGMVFGWYAYRGLRKLPVHQAMRDISELIYETCKTYLQTQGKFIMLLWAFIGLIIMVYFGWLRPVGAGNLLIILLFSLVGIAGSYGVAWFGIRINTFANSRSAFASLTGKAYPTFAIPLRAGISVGTLLISIELIIMLAILLFVPGHLAGYCFIGFAVGESLGAAALRIAGGIFTKIADIGSDLMKIVFNIKEDDARNPGVIADCTGDNAGDSVGPTADGFETYGVTGVALITFILLAVMNPAIQVQLLVWIFVMRVTMIVTSIASYWINGALARGRYGDQATFNFEAPLTSLVWITSIVSIAMTYVISYAMLAELGGGSLWWKLATIISCGTLAGAVIPELVKIFTSTKSRHVKEVVTAAREGGASLNILSGFVAGNFSGYWMGLSIIALMAIAWGMSTSGLGAIMAAAPVFAFGLVAFGFLGMGPVTIAVDSYGPVTDNAQSVYELSTIETIPNIAQDIKREFGFTPDFEKAKLTLEENDGAGNTFKATAKPVLIGTAVVGATTLIFSIILLLATEAAGLEGVLTLEQINQALMMAGYHFSLLNAPFLLGLIAGGAVIYWFTGASTQAVSTGAYRAVEFIKANIRLDGTSQKASVKDSKRVVEICTQYAQKGMFNIFIVVFFTTLAFACVDSYFFIGYLISIAIFGLYQAIFMANAGGAWDNAKKIVETDLREKGTPLHAATVIGDTVGDPFKDTSSVAMNPVIKFTTLFGVLAVELAIELTQGTRVALAALFFAIAAAFVYRSFYRMRITTTGVQEPAKPNRKAAAGEPAEVRAAR